MSEFPSFLQLNNIPLNIYTTFYPYIDGHGLLLAIVDNAGMKMSVPIFLRDPALNYFECIPQNEVSGSNSYSGFNFLEETPYYFPWQLYHFTFPPTVHKALNFFTSLPTMLFSVFFLFVYSSHPNGYEVVSHCGFDLHFPNDL